MVKEDSNLSHPTDEELAAYLGRELEGERLQWVELHLAQCSTCREEIVDAREVLKSPSRVRWTVFTPVAAAAAVALLFIAWPQNTELPGDQPVHREAPPEMGVVPVLVSPVGEIRNIQALVWTRVPGADRFRLTLFDAEGSVLWRATTSDSSIAVPDSVVFQEGRLYLWRVEARVGWDVWETSDLAEFRLQDVGVPNPNPDGSL